MNTKSRTLGMIAILTIAVTMSAFVLPTLAAPIMEQLMTMDKIKASDQIASQDQIQSQDQLQSQERLTYCNETCLQNRTRTQARDGSCGECTGSCTGEGIQRRSMSSYENCLGECSQIKIRRSQSNQSG